MLQRAARGHAAHDGIVGDEVVRWVGVACIRPGVDIAAQVAERGPDLTDGVDHLAAPVGLRDCQRRVGAVGARHGARMRLEAELAAGDRLAEHVIGAQLAFDGLRWPVEAFVGGQLDFEFG